MITNFNENLTAVRGGLAILQAFEREYLSYCPVQSLSGYEMLKEVRGLGMLNGIEFAARLMDM